MDLNKNYYTTLGVDKNADEATIKKAYRELSKKHHPDKGGDGNVFKEINEANSILGDSGKKNQYDTQSKYGKNPNPYSQNPFGNMGGFHSDFGFDMNDFLRRSGFGFTREYENLDLEIQYEVSLDKIYNNGSVVVEFTRYVQDIQPDNSIVLKPKKETVTVNNMAILSDQIRSVRYDGMGNYSKTNRDMAGNIVIHLVPNFGNLYKKIGKDLYVPRKLDIKTAVLGGNIEIEHLDGKTYSVKIPPKSNNGFKYKLREKGLIFNNLGNRGDLYVEVELFVDYDKLTEQDLELISKLS